MNAFKSDLEFGQASEQLLKHRLQLEGIDSTSINDATGDLEYRVMVEVKTDRMWQSTGNIAIEIMRDGQPTGLSTTHADIIVYVLDGVSAFWYVRTSELKSFLKSIKINRVRGGDGNRTEMVLITLSQFFGIFKRL
jgi:hypothetical protein